MYALLVDVEGQILSYFSTIKTIFVQLARGGGEELERETGFEI